MADPAARAVRKYLSALQPGPARTDAELLARYASRRDGEAFAELVRRHGPMVLGVARRLLGSHADAEDTFQSVFLALARHARSVRRGSAGAWLHRVTVHAARRARHRAPAVPLDGVALPSSDADPLAAVAWREVRQALDEELAALPERLREPLVLCYLEALTRDEAARRLGWPLRTLERRLSQGREALGSRLRRRGVSSAALAAAALSPSGLSAEVPRELASSAVRAGVGATAGLGRSGVLGVLFGGKARLAAAAALVTAAVLAGFQPAATGPAAPEPSPPAREKAARAAPAEAPDVPLPAGAVRRFGSMAWRHNGGILRAALSANGKVLATVSGSGTVAVWDAETGRRRHLFRGCDLPPYAEGSPVALSPDGRLLACLAEKDVAARVWDLEKGVAVRSLGEQMPARPAPAGVMDFRRIHFSSDGSRLLVTGSGTVVAYDVATGKESRRTPLQGRVVAVSPDERQFATHDFKAVTKVAVCDAATGNALRKLDGDVVAPPPQPFWLQVVFSPDGKRLATITHPGLEVCVWDAATGKQAGRYRRARSADPLDDEHLTCVAFSPDGRTLLAGGAVWSGVRRWDLTTGQELAPLRGHRGTVSALLPAPGGKVVYSTSNDCTIRRWEMPAGREIPLPDGVDFIAVTALSPDGRVAVTSGMTGRLCVWETRSGRLLRRVPLAGDRSGVALHFSPDGKALATGGWDERPAALFDTATWSPRDDVRMPEGLPLGFTPDGGRLLAQTADGHFGLWDLAAGRFVWDSPERVTVCALRPDGRAFAVTTGKGVSVRDVADGRERLSIPVVPHPNGVAPMPARVDGLAFSPDGRLLACSRGDDDDVHVWDGTTGRPVYQLTGNPPGEPLTVRVGQSAVAFSPNGQWLASGHNDGTVRLWEVATGKEVFRGSQHDALVTGLTFGPDGRTLLVAAGVEVLLRDLRPRLDGRAETPALWAELASDDAALAYRAMHSLAARGAPAVALLRKELKPVAVPDPAATARLIGELESARFAAREKASRELQALGHSARPALRSALGRKPSAEVQARVEALLKRLDQPPAGEELRRLRAVQVLAWAGGDEAEAVLRALAGGAPGVPVTEAAARALRPAPGD